jgi:hypothetical protein
MGLAQEEISVPLRVKVGVNGSAYGTMVVVNLQKLNSSMGLPRIANFGRPGHLSMGSAYFEPGQTVFQIGYLHNNIPAALADKVFNLKIDDRTLIVG